MTTSASSKATLGAHAAYPGGKGLDGVWQWIIGKMPTHAFYVEPFAGKGAILRRKPPALENILIDKDPDVIDWWERLAWPGTIAGRGDGILWLKCHAAELDSDWLVYCDPPYMHSTRSHRRIYKFEMTDEEHGWLLDALVSLACPVMISGYATSTYDRALAGWYRFEHEAITRGRVTRTEVLWTNFDPASASPALALAYGNLGTSFRERERVSRRIKRWTSRLSAMAPIERRALLLACLDVERSAGIVTTVDAVRTSRSGDGCRQRSSNVTSGDGGHGPKGKGGRHVSLPRP